MLRVITCLAVEHDLKLLGLALVVSALGAHASLRLLRHIRPTRGGTRGGWIAAAALITGAATWAAHFIAMLAFNPGTEIGFDLLPTLLSLPVAVGAMALAYHVALAAPQRRAQALGGALLGLGIAAMHYTGMNAMQAAGTVLWDHALVGASVLVGSGFACLALLVGGQRDGQPGGLARGTAAAALLTLAIAGTHLTGMAAATVLPDPSQPLRAGMLPDTSLALGIGFGCILVLLLSLVGMAVERRDLARQQHEAERMRSLADASVEGLLICQGDLVVTANRSFAATLGQDAAGLAGQKLSVLLGNRMLALRLLSRDAQLEGRLPLAEGGSVPVELVSRSITYAGAPHRVVACRVLRDRNCTEAHLCSLAQHDRLTELPHRSAFTSRLETAIGLHRNRGQGFAVLLVNLDQFGRVNEAFGNPAGDALLRQVAERLRGVLREGDVLGRFAGDEFALLQLADEQPGAARLLAERILALLALPFAVSGQMVEITASIGIALFDTDGDSAATLLRHADVALTRAKQEGRHALRFFEPTMNQQLQQRITLERELREALASGQLELFYQPQFGVQNHRITGFEALLRWRHPERGLIPPGAFIPLAEASGLIVPIGAWALREACAEAMRWPGDIQVAVNLSAVQFRSPSLLRDVAEALHASGLPPRRLELEITESILLDDAKATRALLHELRAAGIRVAMDDFGTGYSSLSYLRSFPFDKIKIDRSFVTDVTTSADSAAIVRAIIGLGHSLHIATTVEGVETPEQFAHVCAEGCDQVQGYLIGRPLPREEARAMLQQGRLAA